MNCVEITCPFLLDQNKGSYDKYVQVTHYHQTMDGSGIPNVVRAVDEVIRLQ